MTHAPAGSPRLAEFVFLMGGIMSLNALAIDAMVPALPAIGDSLGIGTDNERQLVLSVYLLGFGMSQLVYGPLADRFGRKPVLLASLLLYAGFGFLCALATSFPLLLAARATQGAAAAGTRVLVVAIVRDQFEGSTMARLMSLMHLVFLIMPILAPAFGQLTLLIAPWRWIFVGLGAAGATMLAWAALRLPETLPFHHRRALSFGTLLDGVRATVTEPQSIGYTLAFTAMMGALFGYIVSIQQVIFDVFGRPELIALTFAAVAAPMAMASLINARIVVRVGARRIAHASLILYTLTAAIHLALAWNGESLALFTLMQGITMACFAIGSANFGALAMQPLGHVAGTASSVQGTIGTIGGGLVGTLIGQTFDGTVVPLIAGFAGLGLLALLIILAVERGRLFGAD